MGKRTRRWEGASQGGAMVVKLCRVSQLPRGASESNAMQGGTHVSATATFLFSFNRTPANRCMAVPWCHCHSIPGRFSQPPVENHRSSLALLSSMPCVNRTFAILGLSASEQKQPMAALLGPPTCVHMVPALAITVLLGIEAVEVPAATTVDEGAALSHSLVVVPPQCEPAAGSLIQGQAARVGWEKGNNEQTYLGRALGPEREETRM